MAKYKFNDTAKLSDHFKVSEFRCKCGGKHDTVLDDELIKMLEKLHKTLGCHAIIVNSGYRCTKHDKAVGGSGTGQHTKGTAADIVCYKSAGNIIDARIVCCVAAELGFGGVANISKKYQAIHVDVRSGAKYYGDEIHGTSSIWKYNGSWTDFYKYFGLSRADVDRWMVGNVQYFPLTMYSGVSIVMALKSIGAQSDFSYRAKIAVVNGIGGYRGTPAQNTKMLELLKIGKLIKP